MRFVLLPLGVFDMGSLEGEVGRTRPRSTWTPGGTKRVDPEGLRPDTRFAEPLYVQVSEVTNHQYRVIDPEHLRGEDVEEGFGRDEVPVTNISWRDARAFAAELSILDRSRIYRRPREVEWEYAARGGRTSPEEPQT